MERKRGGAVSSHLVTLPPDVLSSLQRNLVRSSTRGASQDRSDDLDVHRAVPSLAPPPMDVVDSWCANRMLCTRAPRCASLSASQWPQMPGACRSTPTQPPFGLRLQEMDRSTRVVDDHREGVGRRTIYGVVELPPAAVACCVVRRDLQLEEHPARVENIG
jgi:hypothetical protein